MIRNIILATAIGFVAFTSCKKKSDFVDEYATSDTTGVLKEVSDVPVGVGVRLELFKSDTAYASLVKHHFNSVTFENELKHASIVSNEGEYDYTKSDEFVNIAQSAGLNIHGHALVDYQSSNYVYLQSLTAATAEVNAVPNPGFETGSGNIFSNWVTQVGPGATGTFEAETSSAYSGVRALKANVVTPGPYQYSMQAYSDLFTLVPGQVYSLNFYAKANVHGSRFKAIIQNSTYQEKTFFITENWEKYTFSFQANESSLSVKFHFPFAGVFYFDDISIMRPASGSFNIDPVKVDSAMKQFITNTVSRYKNRINAWDVVNEPFAEGGVLRSSVQGGAVAGNFYFADHLGAGYIAKAFEYAHSANPSATLFINEDKLESDGGKLDAMVNLINQLKTQGVPIDGIGIQMHLTTKNDRSGIEKALTKLAATGLKIRISEMDVRVNPWNTVNFRPSNDDLIAQRDLYRFTIGAYYRLIPVSQRYGITFWDPSDKYSWIITNQNKEDAPALFDASFQKKPAYYGVIVGMRKKN